MFGTIKRISMALLFVLLIASVGHAATTWKIGHIRQPGTPEDISCHFFANRLSELTDGEIKVVIYPASQLGDWTVVMQRIGLNAIEFGLQPQDTQMNKRLAFTNLPYLFTSLDELRVNFAADSPLRKVMDAEMAKCRVKVLCWWPAFASGLGLTKLPANLDDPEAKKDLKIRIPSDPTFSVLYAREGFMPTPIAFSDTFPALQTGVVDGVAGTGKIGNYSSFRDVIKYYVDTQDFYIAYPLMMSMTLWNKQSQQMKEKILQAAAEMEAARYASYAKDEEEYGKKLSDSGVEMIPLKPEVLQAYAKLARERCWPEIAKKIDKKFYDETAKLIKR